MAIFRVTNNRVSQIPLNQKGFGSEFDLRDLFATNLEEILGVRFLEKEYSTNDGGRIDTLGIDENDSPVIIEYKWLESDDKVLAQGLWYLTWLQKNRRHFELLVSDKLGDGVIVNWDQPRVILIAQGFSGRMEGAVQQLSNVELKTYNYYEPDILHLDSLYNPVGLKNAVKKNTVDSDTIYDLNYHIAIAVPELQKAANQLRDLILQLPSVEEKVGQKSGITYKTTKSFTRLEFRKTWVHLLLRDPSYKSDTQGLVKDISSNEWGYKGMVKFTSESDVEYVFKLIKASYESTL